MNDSIFQYRTAAEELKAAETAPADAQAAALEIESISCEKGLWVNLKGSEVPLKGLPMAEAVVAANIVKKTAKLFPRITLKEFLSITKPVMQPWILKREYQTDCTKNLIWLIMSFLVDAGIEHHTALEVAEIVAHVFEYDGGWRFRLQDLATEANILQLSSYPRREIKRLLAISGDRDYNEASQKVARIGKLLTMLLLIPKYNRAFKNALTVYGITGLKFDENDWFWAKQKVDYDYGGLKKSGG